MVAVVEAIWMAVKSLEGGKMLIKFSQDEPDPPGGGGPPPDLPPPPPPNGSIGADPSVGEGTFDISGYPTPTPRDPVVTLEQFGGAVGQDSTDALKKALDAIKSGGTLAVDNGLYGLNGSTRFGGLDNVSIIGKGRGSGFMAVNQPWPGSEWRCLLEFENSENLFIDNLEIDGRNQRIGHIWHKNDRNTWLTRLYMHDIGGSASQRPLAAIKGADESFDFHAVGLEIARGWGDAGGSSGVRGFWGPNARGYDGALIEQCLIHEMGHSGLIPYCGKGGQTIVKNVTSWDNAGASLKTETPEDYQATGGRQQSDVWFPDDYRCLISHCDFRRSGFHGVQAEGVGTSVRNCYIEGHTNGVATFNRLLRVEVVNCLMKNDKEAGIWCSLDQGQKFGALEFHFNTIEGGKGRAGIGFDPKCTSPLDAIRITEDKTDPGVVPLSVTSQISDHDGFHSANNGPSGKGATAP